MADGVFHDFIGGWVSGIAGVLVGHPFDTVKVQLQVQEKKDQYKNVWDCISWIRKQKLSEGFFRGMTWPLLSAGIINSVFFGGYSQVLKILGTTADKQHEHPDYLKVGVASGAGGIFQLLIACPVEVIKVVLQSQIPHGTHQGMKFYHNPLEGMLDIVRQNGLRGIYRGFSVQCPRDVIGSIVYFTTFEYMSHIGSVHLKTIPHPVVNLFAGGVAGVLSWVVIMPLDVIKSRVQADVDRQLYQNFLDCVIKSYQQGGIRIFFRGIGITCLRAFPVNALTLMVYAEYMKFFDARFIP